MEDLTPQDLTAENFQFSIQEGREPKAESNLPIIFGVIGGFLFLGIAAAVAALAICKANSYKCAVTPMGAGTMDLIPPVETVGTVSHFDDLDTI